MDKRAPVQGWAAGIPWEMHLEAYSAYCKKYGPQKALIEGGCRGGFGTGELDMFIPGWRERSSRTVAIESALRELVRLKDLKTDAEAINCSGSWDAKHKQDAMRAEYEKAKPLAWGRRKARIDTV